MDRGALWATVHGVAKSWTQLKQLSTYNLFQLFKLHSSPNSTSKTIPWCCLWKIARNVPYLLQTWTPFFLCFLLPFIRPLGSVRLSVHCRSSPTLRATWVLFPLLLQGQPCLLRSSLRCGGDNGNSRRRPPPLSQAESQRVEDSGGSSHYSGSHSLVLVLPVSSWIPSRGKRADGGTEFDSCRQGCLGWLKSRTPMSRNKNLGIWGISV